MICTALHAVMICQACDLDKKILQKMYPFLQYFLERITGDVPKTVDNCFFAKEVRRVREIRGEHAQTIDFDIRTDRTRTDSHRLLAGFDAPFPLKKQKHLLS